MPKTNHLPTDDAPKGTPLLPPAPTPKPGKIPLPGDEMTSEATGSRWIDADHRDSRVPGLAKVGSLTWEPSEDYDTSLPPGTIAYIPRAQARYYTGDPMPVAHNPQDAAKIETQIRDAVTKRAGIRYRMNQVQIRETELYDLARRLSSVRSRRGCYAEAVKMTQLWARLALIDSTFEERILALGEAAGWDIGKIQSPEEALMEAKPTPSATVDDKTAARGRTIPKAFKQTAPMIELDG